MLQEGDIVGGRCGREMLWGRDFEEREENALFEDEIDGRVSSLSRHQACARRLRAGRLRKT